jgi:hypothetical protein
MMSDGGIDMLGYSTVFLDKIGVSAALVLQGLYLLQRGASIRMDGKLWFFCPIRRHQCDKSDDADYWPLDDCYPWLGKSGLSYIIRKLTENGLLEINNDYKNWPGYAWNVNKDRANFYHVPAEVCCRLEDRRRRRFIRTSEAVAGGISVAVVLNYMRGMKSGGYLSKRDTVKHLLREGALTLPSEMNPRQGYIQLLKDASISRIFREQPTRLSRTQMEAQMHLKADTIKKAFRAAAEQGFLEARPIGGLETSYELTEGYCLNERPQVIIRTKSEPIGKVESEIVNVEMLRNLNQTRRLTEVGNLALAS